MEDMEEMSLEELLEMLKSGKVGNINSYYMGMFIRYLKELEDVKNEIEVYKKALGLACEIPANNYCTEYCHHKYYECNLRGVRHKECFNTQGFPQSFKLPATMSDAKLYKQAGNSVCVTVIQRIAEQIAAAEGGKKNDT